MSPVVPTLELEERLLGEAPLVFGLDEVGRGALAGPVTVAASVIDSSTLGTAIPEGLRDSKLVTERNRPRVAERAAAWVRETTLGWATPGEVDEAGIMGALGLAASRALQAMRERGFDPADGISLLDGNHDYLSRLASPVLGPLDVRTVVKGDRDRAVISAASIAAKVSRDAVMVELHDQHEAYAWQRNKGYASAAHRAAIDEHGLTVHHRRSWAIGPALSRGEAS
ncbi:MAG TPA: ribonuclease HII [Candidatus Microbacterium stercoravium]|uniref:Ribonuclease n=1 Tax=Candidatus Microbacterium stercoravium TaxID=2838697 RepID=A0A9D2H7D2_9MICO|nr:ribonuclease HII [Candidatus Microbacterium stercoravium]